MSTITCKALVNHLSREIPDDAIALMSAHLHSVDLFLGQFQEWHEFCQNSASIDLDDDALEILKRATSEISETLKKVPGLADPKVPKIFAFLNECINNPDTAKRRVGYATLTTIENLVSCIFSYASKFLDDTMRSAIKTASIAVGGLLGLATIGILGAELIAPISGATAQGRWIVEALRMLKVP